MTGNKRIGFQKKTFVLFIALITIVLVGFDNVSAASLSHDAKFSISGDGELYFSVGPRLEACHIDSHKEFSSACRITSGKTYSLPSLVDRGIIVQPGDKALFEGFFDSSGRKIALKAIKMDILRVKVGGTYVYTHYPAFGDVPATMVTKPLYGEMVKKYVKALYNTSRYSVMGQETVYTLPKKSLSITVRFREKEVPKLGLPDTIKKTFGDADFSVVKSVPDGISVKCSSSSSKVLSVAKASGLAAIKGTGIAKVTVATPDTDLYQSSQQRIKVYIHPAKLTGLSAVKKSPDSVIVNWNSSSGCSGYEIEFSPTSSFSRVIARGKSAKASSESKTFKIPKEEYKSCRYVRVRGYKKSCGEVLYGEYSRVKVQ